MKQSVAKFVLVIMSIICVVCIAVFGIRSIKIPGVFDDDGIRLGLDLAGGSTIVYEPVEGANPSPEDINTAIVMIRNRLDLLNYSEATVTSSGQTSITVEIPGISNPEDAVQQLGASAVLEFRDADGNVVVSGKDIKNAVAAYSDTGKGYAEHHIVVTFNSDSISKFAEATRKAAIAASDKRYIAIYLDNNLMMSPSVEKEINSESCVITGNYDKATAEYYAGIISAGRLPFDLVDVQLSSTGPALGEKSLSSSLIAGGIGVILVIIFMIAYYRLPGAIASLALIGYVGLTGIVLVLTQANLSLPGIAGIILAIGMAVDANVIIFERIKEELRAGKTIKASVNSGFHRAFTAIIDSNVTTLIAAGVLWYFGTGPIKGFATTLFFGILISMFTAIVVTRILINNIVDLKIRNPKMYGL